MVSSKTEGLETLGALRTEGCSPGFTAQWPGSGPLPAQTGTVLGFPAPTPPHPSGPGLIPAHALQIPHLSSGLLRADPCLPIWPRSYGCPGPQTALPGVFPTTLGATFLKALPTSWPQLSANASVLAQSLEKELRRAGTTGTGVLHVITRAWDGPMQGSQNLNLK